MATKLGKEFDIQDYLINTENDPAAFLQACVEVDPGDGSLVRRALSELKKANHGRSDDYWRSFAGKTLGKTHGKTKPARFTHRSVCSQA